MTMFTVVLIGILLPLALGTIFVLWWQRPQEQGRHDQLSPVTRQHLELYQGGQLSGAAVEAAKARFRELLERGDMAGVEASLRPGTHFVVQVRALTEIGTDDAGRILERQLQRRISYDRLEQSWYWLDLASGLRSLQREESLPHLLNCAASGPDLPLGHFFAAETICFFGFAGYLCRPDSPHGQTALRLLHRALEGFHHGVPPQVVAEARLGETLELLWDHLPPRVDPLIVRIAFETLRLLARSPHFETLFIEDHGEEEVFSWQMSHLNALEPALRQYVQEAPRQLLVQLSRSVDHHFPDLLAALNDLRVDTGTALLPWLNRSCPVPLGLIIGVLAWAPHQEVGARLRAWTRQRVAMSRRAQRRRQADSPRRPSVPATIPYREVLQALRRHPGLETEEFLCLAAQDWDPFFRAAALGSLGWGEPVNWEKVVACLQQGRRDANAEVRQAARAALARLGQRQALQWFRQALTSENLSQLHEAIQVIALEGLTLLWPDLDRLADADDPDLAYHAREALERLREELAKQPV